MPRILLAGLHGLGYLNGLFERGAAGVRPGGPGAVMRERQAQHDQLIDAHQARLRGFMRARVYGDGVADDLVQETWVEVLRHLDTFDERQGSFWAFVLIWAKLVLKRHRSTSAAAQERDGGEPAGADLASPNPEAALMRATVVTELLRRVLACTRPPHEVVTFGFAKLKWTPREIVEELSDTRLGELARRLEAEYTALVPSPAVRTAFGPLRERLASRLGALLRDPRTRRAYDGLLDRVAGETTLREYFPADHPPEQAIVWWWGFVKRTVLTELQSAARGELFEWITTGAPG